MLERVKYKRNKNRKQKELYCVSSKPSVSHSLPSTYFKNHELESAQKASDFCGIQKQ